MASEIFNLLIKAFFFWYNEKHRLVTSDDLLVSIQEKIKWADTMSELDKKHGKEVEEKVEEVKKSLKVS